MKKSVDNNFNNNYGSIIFINAFKNILNSINDALDEYKYCIDEWHSNKNVTTPGIKADIQNVLIYDGLNRVGWINRLMIFLSYSRNPTIKDKMKEH
jgi:hypothetical protein